MLAAPKGAVQAAILVWDCAHFIGCLRQNSTGVIEMGNLLCTMQNYTEGAEDADLE